MNALGYQSCKADSDLWMKPEARPQKTFECDSYILYHVDDIFFIHHNPGNLLNKLNGNIPLKPGCI